MRLLMSRGPLKTSQGMLTNKENLIQCNTTTLTTMDNKSRYMSLHERNY